MVFLGDIPSLGRRAIDGQHLIYFADPMCSWCWGFSPVIAAISQAWGERAPIRLILGGLRPGTREAMTPAARQEIAGHWRHVHEASGQAFVTAALDAEGFVYDTDPAARAVVLARRSGSTRGLAFLRLAHEAFYAQGRDVTSSSVLADIAADLGLDRETFLAALDSEDLKQETWRDYAISRGAGVTGFPTLIAGPRPDGTFMAISRGYQPADIVLPMIERWMAVAA